MSSFDLRYLQNVDNLEDTVNMKIRRHRDHFRNFRRLEVPNKKHFRQVLRYQRRRFHLRHSRLQVLMESIENLYSAFRFHREQKMVLVWKPASPDVTEELTKLVTFHDYFLEMLEISKKAVDLKCKYRDFKRLQRIQKQSSQIIGFENEVWNVHFNDAIRCLSLFVFTTVK